MTALDALNMDAELEARSTGTAVSITATTALGLMLAITGQSQCAAAALSPQEVFTQDGHQSSSQLSIPQELGAKDFVLAIAHVHEILLKNQAELDPESRRILSENLWSLYE